MSGERITARRRPATTSGPARPGRRRRVGRRPTSRATARSRCASYATWWSATTSSEARGARLEHHPGGAGAGGRADQPPQEDPAARALPGRARGRAGRVMALPSSVERARWGRRRCRGSTRGRRSGSGSAPPGSATVPQAPSSRPMAALGGSRSARESAAMTSAGAPPPGPPPAPLRAPGALERLTRLRERSPARADALEEACQLAADPDLALAGADRFADAAGGLPLRARPPLGAGAALRRLADGGGAARPRSPSPAPHRPLPAPLAGPHRAGAAASCSSGRARGSTPRTWPASTGSCDGCAFARWRASRSATSAGRPCAR